MLTRKEMDAGQCEVPGCDHRDHGGLFLMARCHPSGGVEIFYRRETGSLHVRCRRCKGPVVDIAVAPAALDARERAAILCGLLCYKRTVEGRVPPSWPDLEPIATDNGSHAELEDEDVDALIARFGAGMGF